MKLGISPSSILKAQLTTDRLVVAITTAVTNPVMQQQAKAIGATIRAENGIQEAIEVMDHYLATSKHRVAQCA